MKSCIASLILLFLSMSAAAIEFKYSYNLGDQYRFLSKVRTQSYFIDDEIVNEEILNRIAFRVVDVEGASGHLVGTLHTSNSSPNSLEASLWRSDYPTDFWRDERGFYDVAPEFFMPMVRNVPFFPLGDVSIGRKWIARGLEVHDIQRLVGVSAPFRIPFTVYYEYVGPINKEGKEYHHIKATYKYTAAFPSVLKLKKEESNYPVSIIGNYDQDIYWDTTLGQPSWYVEEFTRQIVFKNGDVYHTTGQADAYLIESKPMDKSIVQHDVENQIKTQGIEDVRVERSALGIKLVLDNIGFKPNTNDFLDGERDKLDKIGEILLQYPDRDIKISGHTARATNEAIALTLSAQRALAVSDYLLKKGYKKQEHLVTEGLGSSQPIADNNTPEGMTKNRRVEITILEN